MEFKVGDYVETDWESCGVEADEQGIVIDDRLGQGSLKLMFPARKDQWATELGLLVAHWHLKLLYRPGSSKGS